MQQILIMSMLFISTHRPCCPEPSQILCPMHCVYLCVHPRLPLNPELLALLSIYSSEMALSLAQLQPGCLVSWDAQNLSDPVSWSSKHIITLFLTHQQPRSSQIEREGNNCAIIASGIPSTSCTGLCFWWLVASVLPLTQAWERIRDARALGGKKYSALHCASSLQHRNCFSELGSLTCHSNWKLYYT